VICAGQSHDSASLFTADMLAHQARTDGVDAPLPPVPPWLGSMARFDPSRVVFVHDLSVWEPADPD
jgi:N-acyl homoserine lactone hydrolase